MAWLPWHIDPCCGGTRSVNVVSDGTTDAYECPECGELIADVISGAEP